MEKRQRLLGELEEARIRQFNERQTGLADVANAEREQFMRILNEQRRAEEKDKLIGEKKHAAYAKHSTSIREQISNKSELKKQ